MSQLNQVSRTTLVPPPLEATVDISQLSERKESLMQQDTNTGNHRHTQNKSVRACANTQMDAISPRNSARLKTHMV